MYRVFCENYKNYMRQFDIEEQKANYRLKIAVPISLLANPEEYDFHKNHKTIIFKHTSDLLFYIGNNLDKYPKLKAFLWTLESRGIKGENFGISRKEDLIEQAKLVNMFVALMYWDEEDRNHA